MRRLNIARRRLRHCKRSPARHMPIVRETGAHNDGRKADQAAWARSSDHDQGKPGARRRHCRRPGGRRYERSADLARGVLSAVQYVPRKDVDMTLLQRTDHATYCPYKGECAYYSIPAGGERANNAVWTYESPYDAVVAIKDHLAFYPQRV